MSLAKNVEFLRRVSSLNHLNGFGHYGRPVPPDARTAQPIGAGKGIRRKSRRAGDVFLCAGPNPCASPRLSSCCMAAARPRPATTLGPAGRRSPTVRLCAVYARTAPANNANACFNWFNPATCAGSGRSRFDPADDREDRGRPRHQSSRIFVTGLSAGGAMTSVMLASTRSVCRRRVIAGLPYGAATNVREAFGGMFQLSCPPGSPMGRPRAPGASLHEGPVAARLGVARQRRQGP